MPLEKKVTVLRSILKLPLLSNPNKKCYIFDSVLPSENDYLKKGYFFFFQKKNVND